MSEPPCDLLAAELALDRLAAELATELPGHVRAFAQAHAAGMPPPPAPAVARRPSSLAAARAALAHPVLADRALALLRVIAPIAIDDDPAVARARGADASWDALAALVVARDAAAHQRFGGSYTELMHTLHGAGPLAAPVAWPEPIDGWHDRIAPLSWTAVADAWAHLAEQHGVHGSPAIVASAEARPRTFVVAPGKAVIVVVPASIDTPAARFAVLHELGHALLAFAGPAEPPRTLDEAVAAYVARSIEAADHPWHTPLATDARRRRFALATTLDAIERALPAFTAPPTERPPWALWHDPCSQAAYVAAEAIADRWTSERGGAPTANVLANAIADTRTRLDHAAATRLA